MAGGAVMFPILLLTLIGVHEIREATAMDVAWVEGSYVLTSSRKEEELIDGLQKMGYSEEMIEKFKNHPTAGNFQLKVLNSGDEKGKGLEIELSIEKLSGGKHVEVLKIRDSKTKFFNSTFWMDGKEYIGYIDEISENGSKHGGYFTVKMYSEEYDMCERYFSYGGKNLEFSFLCRQGVDSKRGAHFVMEFELEE